MKLKLYKNAAITFFILNFWTVIHFFIYLLDKRGFTRGVINYFLFEFSMLFVLILGIIVLLLRIYKKQNAHSIKSHFIYFFTGVFSIYIILIFFALISLKIMPIMDYEILILISSNGLLSLLFLADLFIFKNKES